MQSKAILKAKNIPNQGIQRKNNVGGYQYTLNSPDRTSNKRAALPKVPPGAGLDTSTITLMAIALPSAENTQQHSACKYIASLFRPSAWHCKDWEMHTNENAYQSRLLAFANIQSDCLNAKHTTRACRRIMNSINRHRNANKLKIPHGRNNALHCAATKSIALPC